MILYEQLAKFLKNPTTAARRSRKSVNKMEAEMMLLLVDVFQSIHMCDFNVKMAQQKVDSIRLKNDVILSFDVFLYSWLLRKYSNI